MESESIWGGNSLHEQIVKKEIKEETTKKNLLNYADSVL